MGKFGVIALVIVGVAMCYLMMLFYMPVINLLVESANATFTAGVEARMPGSQSGLVAMPWILWWLPGTLGMVIVVVILKKA